MSVKKELEYQREYWNKEIFQFDSIYTHEKNMLKNLLDRIFRKDMYQRFEYTMKNSEPIKDKTFLDVGCGTGKYLFEFVRRGCKHIIGIDISDLMIEQCKTTATKQGIQNKTTFLQGDLIRVNIEQKVDICIGIGLFDYIKNSLPILEQMRKYTNDRVIMSFPRFWTWRAPVRKIRLSLKKCPVYFYTRKRVEELLKKAGFKIYLIEKVGKLFCVTAWIKN